MNRAPFRLDECRPESLTFIAINHTHAAILRSVADQLAISGMLAFTKPAASGGLTLLPHMRT